jgi:hypothetical protein
MTDKVWVAAAYSKEINALRVGAGRTKEAAEAKLRSILKDWWCRSVQEEGEVFNEEEFEDSWWKGLWADEDGNPPQAYEEEIGD